MRLKNCKFILIILLIFPLIASGGVVEDLNKQIQDHEARRIELEQQSKEYQKIINQKKGEISSLKDKIYVFNAEIGKFETDINITEEKVDQTNAEITQLEYGLEQAKEDIDQQKSNLIQIIQNISEYDNTNDLEIILQSDNFSNFFDQLNYLKNLQNGVQQKVENLKLLKKKITTDKEEKENKKEELENLKSELATQKSSLDAQKNQKESLLSKTKGEEGQYQNLLSSIEKQKESLLGDINRLLQQKATELARLKELQEKPPKKYWASTSWYYRQDDPQWAKTTIGFSNSLMENYGCAISSIAMVFTKQGSRITPGQLAKERIFYYDLIVWPKSWENIQCINCPPAHTSSFDWFKLDRELGAGNPVVIFVRAIGRNAGHYVVVHHKTDDGRYVVHDPLFGDNIYLDSTQVYISNLYNTTTRIDQMVIYR
ncbi:C39 family peptidase [Patescibacteria group bacterium]